MVDDSSSWERRVAAVWQTASDGRLVISAIDALAGERSVDDPVAVYERASARDFAGREAEAEALYRRALSLGLADADRRRGVEATVQLSSTLRLLGRPDEAVAVIDEVPVEVLDDDRDWLVAFRALALLEAGRAEESARCALRALSGHLTQYADAVRRYAG
jgi:tetratricopeptide (TPR) repeat protein